MHELALMEELRRLAVAAAEAEGAQQLLRLRLRLGTGAGVDAEALRLAFAVVMAHPDPGSAIATDHTSLELELVPTRCFCADCRQEFTPADVIHACPRCGALSSQVLEGRELELAELEVA
jgi:hydrogenase nickel incorporation protein HypA/HybF